MLPQGRLLTLLEQALHAQTADTLLHNAARPNMSLLSAYRPGLGQVPTRPTQMVPIPAMLMAFSPNGRILACADTDGDATLHSVRPGRCSRLHAAARALTMHAFGWDRGLGWRVEERGRSACKCRSEAVCGLTPAAL